MTTGSGRGTVTGTAGASAASSRPFRASSGSSFHYSFGLLPKERRLGIQAVYAFCRVIDDLADEGPHDPERAARDLEMYREEIDRCYAGAAALPITRHLQDCVRRFDIPRQPFDDLLDGVAMDLHKTRYRDFDELRLYCRRVASAVGLVCLPIFGCGDGRSRDYAVDLGIALQLTNILRDLKVDATRGRIYVPLDEIVACDYSEAQLLRGERTPAFLALMRRQAERARRHFESAALLLPDSDRNRLLAAEVMRAIYLRLLCRIERREFRVFERRISVPRLQQLGVTLRAWAFGEVGP